MGMLVVLVATAAVVWLRCWLRRRREGMDKLAISSGCVYTYRVQAKDGKWVCPEGTVDTGRTWGDADGDKQCLMGCAVNPNCQYTTRVFKNGAWRCPAGYVDSGLTWGVAYGDRQCQKCPQQVNITGKKCSFTGREWMAEANEWRCPAGTLETGSKENWNACLLACCPVGGYKGREGGTSNLFPCGKWDIEREGGIAGPDGVPTELYPFCCQWTNKDCKAKAFRGLFQGVADIGTRDTGYYTKDDGCNVNVWDQHGNKVAVTGKGLGKWGAIGIFAGVGVATVGTAVFIGPGTALTVATLPMLASDVGKLVKTIKK